MTSSEKLLVRIRELGIDISQSAKIRRTYAGHIQRSKGAWSWFVVDRESCLSLGGVYPVKELLKSTTLVSSVDDFGQITIDAVGLGHHPIDTD